MVDVGLTRRYELDKCPVFMQEIELKRVLETGKGRGEKELVIFLLSPRHAHLIRFFFGAREAVAEGTGRRALISISKFGSGFPTQLTAVA